MQGRTQMQGPALARDARHATRPSPAPPTGKPPGPGPAFSAPPTGTWRRPPCHPVLDEGPASVDARTLKLLWLKLQPLTYWTRDPRLKLYKLQTLVRGTGMDENPHPAHARLQTLPRERLPWPTSKARRRLTHQEHQESVKMRVDSNLTSQSLGRPATRNKLQAPAQLPGSVRCHTPLHHAR